VTPPTCFLDPTGSSEALTTSVDLKADVIDLLGLSASEPGKRPL